MAFQDHFSCRARDYARYRPVYPPRLFARLAALAPARDLAWDCGTGNGQAACGLAAYFRRVIATDASAEQIANAVTHARIRYRVAPAERTKLAAQSVDLITVAQALHWFNFERFYREARRVLKPRGVLAAWCYGLARVDSAVDGVVQEFYDAIVGPYWPPERGYLDSAYRTIPFPWRERPVPRMHMRAHWSRDEFIGYLGTWSAVRRYAQARGGDPLDLIGDRLARVWGPRDARRSIVWPIDMRIGTAGRGV